MKKFLLTLCSALFGLSCFAANGDTFTIDDITYRVLNETKKTCSVYMASRTIEGEVVIPASVTNSATGGTYNVTEVASIAFQTAKLLTKVTLPEGITTISGGFNNSGIKEINLPSTLTKISTNPFVGCPNDIVFDISPSNQTFSFSKGMLIDKVTKTVVYINHTVKEFNLPTGIINVGPHAGSSSDVEIVNIPDSNEPVTFNNYAFYQSKVNRINAGKTRLTLKDYVFAFCDNLKNVDLSGLAPVGTYKHALYLGKENFCSCKNLESFIFPKKCSDSGSGTFIGCTNLTNVTFSQDLGILGSSLFNTCSSFDLFSLPETVYRLNDKVFYKSGLVALSIPIIKDIELWDGDESIFTKLKAIPQQFAAECPELSSVYIANGLQSINSSAFNKCSQLDYVFIASSTPPTLSTNSFVGISPTATLYVPIGSKTSYEAITGYSDNFARIVEVNFSTMITPAEITIKITDDAVARNGSTAEVGVDNSLQLVADLWPEDCYLKKVKWISSDPSVASVDENGLVKGESVGSTTIKAYTLDGSLCKAEMPVLVSQSVAISGVADTDSSSITLYNLAGQAVYTGTPYNWNGIASGVYIMKGKSNAKKIIIR